MILFILIELIKSFCFLTCSFGKMLEYRLGSSKLDEFLGLRKICAPAKSTIDEITPFFFHNSGLNSCEPCISSFFSLLLISMKEGNAML